MSLAQALVQAHVVAAVHYQHTLLANASAPAALDVPLAKKPEQKPKPKGLYC